MKTDTLAVAFAIGSIAAHGAFYPTLNIYFNAPFVSRFKLPCLSIAIANIYTLANHLGWWTVGVYGLAYMAGSIATGCVQEQIKRRALVFGGGVWLVGVAMLVLCAASYLP